MVTSLIYHTSNYLVAVQADATSLIYSDLLIQPHLLNTIWRISTDLTPIWRISLQIWPPLMLLTCRIHHTSSRCLHYILCWIQTISFISGMDTEISYTCDLILVLTPCRREEQNMSKNGCRSRQIYLATRPFIYLDNK